jgi:RNA-directed DNA polymerase
LQTRITKAAIQNKWNLVKRLQYLLTHSYFAKLLAVRRVTQNKGKRTPGIDVEKWLTSNSMIKAVLSLTGKGYKAKPLKESSSINLVRRRNVL